MNDAEGAHPRTPSQIAAWLSAKPSLEQMQQFFPDEWTVVQGQAARLLRGGDTQALTARLEQMAAPLTTARDRMRPRRELALVAVRREMLLATVQRALLRHETGVERGAVRFGLLNGAILQRLLFERGLRRRAVNYVFFRAVWPLVPQRKRLMPLVMEQGIYCFYSDRLLTGLKSLIDGRAALEIAAGDGTLTRLLGERGVSVTATDDRSWGIGNRDEESVEQLDAAAALRRYQPSVVVCSWPPPGNEFERHVFLTDSVDLYVVITTRKEYAAGNWNEYRQQTAFSMEDVTRLGRYVVPEVTDPCVLVFRRRGVSGGAGRRGD